MGQNLSGKKRAATHELLHIGALLALTGGFLDAYTYLMRGGVFANAETGNLVLVGLHLAEAQFGEAGKCAVQILAFFCGVLCGEWIKRRFTEQQQLSFERIIVLLEAGLLIAVGFVPASAPDVLVNLTVAFVCALQVNTFRKTGGLPYATTMCTGNLRSGAEYFYKFLLEKDRTAGRAAGRYLFIIGMFLLGAVAGALFCGLLGLRAVWICGGILLVVFWILNRGK